MAEQGTDVSIAERNVKINDASVLRQLNLALFHAAFNSFNFHLFFFFLKYLSFENFVNVLIKPNI